MTISRTTRQPITSLMLRFELPGPFARLLPRMSIMQGIIPPAMISRDWVRQIRGGESPKSSTLTADMHLHIGGCQLSLFCRDF